MTPDELIEAAAKAIWCARHPSQDRDHNWDDYLTWYRAGAADPSSSVHYSTIGEAMRDARAAAAVIIEACAKRIEQMKSPDLGNAYTRDCNAISDRHAAAIRALAAKPEGA